MNANEFWSHVRREGADECWEWGGGLRENGYGWLWMNGKQQAAHRVSYTLANSQIIPNGMCVCHHCDNKKCVNPHHLFLGSQQDNTADRCAKGRSASGQRNGAYTQPHKRVRGETHGRAKLTNADVVAIRHRAEKETQQSLADEYGVSQTEIGRIIHRKVWTNI